MSELGDLHPNVIVLPEYSNIQEVDAVSNAYPESIVVAAVQVDRQSKGILRHLGVDRVEYPKVKSDGETDGTGKLPRTPFYEVPAICVGMIICMDVQSCVVEAVTQAVIASKSKFKLICIPARMGEPYFSAPILIDPHYEGMHVALCNSLTYGGTRIKSFITDAHRTKVREQQRHEAINWDAP